MSVIAEHDFVLHDFRVMRLESVRQDETVERNESSYVVTPHQVVPPKSDDTDDANEDAHERRVVLLGTLEWRTTLNRYRVGVGGLFEVSPLSVAVPSGEAPARNSETAFEAALDLFSRDYGAYLVFDFAQRQLRLLASIHEEDTGAFEAPDVQFVSAAEVERQRREASSASVNEQSQPNKT